MTLIVIITDDYIENKDDTVLGNLEVCVRKLITFSMHARHYRAKSVNNN